MKEIFQLDRKAGLPLEGQQEAKDAVSFLQSREDVLEGAWTTLLTFSLL